jgi:hypothetical protein
MSPLLAAVLAACLPAAPSTPPAPVRVLHVGDSMVAAIELRPTERFVSLLGGVPGTAHVNAGVVGTGPDFHSLVIHRWTRRLPFQHVVQ